MADSLTINYNLRLIEPRSLPVNNWGIKTNDNWTLLDATLKNLADNQQPLNAVLTATTAAFTIAQQTKLSGIATGATANASDAFLVARANHTGTQAWSTLTGTPTTLAGYGIADGITSAAVVAGYQPLASVLTGTTASFTTAQQTKLSSIATGATANSADAVLLDRANHTGTQAWSTLTGTPVTLSGYGITGTKAQFNTAVTDGDIMYIGDAPTAHTHLLAAGATDVTITAANLNTLDDGIDTTLHFHAADRARANHTGTQTWATITSTPTTIAGYAISDAASLTGVQTLTNKTVTDATFTIQDDADNTKKAQFQASGITTGTTATFTLPASSTPLASLNLAQTFAAACVFSSANFTGGNSTAAGVIGLGIGATISASLKQVNVGTSGVSGSFTTMTFGSAFGTNTTFYGNVCVKAVPPTVISAAQTLTLSDLQSGAINYTGPTAALTYPLGTAVEGMTQLQVDTGLLFSVINNGSGSATMTVNTGITMLGSAIVAAGASGLFRMRKTATNTFVADRLS